jgi:hypothetical protein
MVLEKSGPDPIDIERDLYALRKSPGGPTVTSPDASVLCAIMDRPSYKEAVAKMAGPSVTLVREGPGSFTLRLSVIRALNTAGDVIEL